VPPAHTAAAAPGHSPGKACCHCCGWRRDPQHGFSLISRERIECQALGVCVVVVLDVRELKGSSGT